MPIFEYRCSKCNEVFEQLRLSRTDNHIKCPHCGAVKAKQLVSVFAAQTGGKSADSGSECYNRAAGICQAGGGSMACGRDS